MEHDNLNEVLLEKLKVYSQKPNDCIEGVRSVAARLHSRAASQDKFVKTKTLERIWQKNQGGLTLILYMLETVRDPLTAVSLAGILHECVATKTGKNRSPAISQLVHLNATQSLTKQLNALQVKESIPVNDILIQEIIWTLSQLAQRDSKFSLKTRLLGAVKTFHYFLKAYHNHAKLLHPILLITKALSRNSNTSAVLAKDGIVTTMEKVLSNIGFTPSVKLRLTLNIFSYLSKNKHGRKAVRSLSGVAVLYKFCQSCPEDKLYDQILARVCGIVNFCLERKTLPVEETCNPAKFVLPNVSDSVLGDKSSSPLRDTTPDFDEGDSEDELLDDLEEDGVVQVQGVDPDESKILPQIAKERNVDDLKMYSNFCKELMQEFGENATTQSNFSKSQTSSNSNSKTMLRIRKERSKTMMSELYNKCTFLALDKGRYLTTNIKFLSKEKLHNLDMRFISSEVSLTNKYRPKVAVDNFIDRRKMSVENLLENSKKTPSNSIQPKVYSKEDLISLNILKNLHQEHGMLHAYSMIASQVKSVAPFVKVAYPDLMGGEGFGKLEPLSVKDRKVCRQKLLESVDKGFQSTSPMCNVVYDLDSLITNAKTGSAQEKRELFNNDEKRIGEKLSVTHLVFESRFESGNLRKAIQVGPREYELVLNSDVNSDRHHNWFYFEINNMDNTAPYIFNIVNFEKMNSQFNYGMKPILYSVQEALLGRPGWIRTGTDICYFRNSYQKTTGQQKCYFTTTFSITFQHNLDVCYIAYHFPYTYSQLLSRIWKWSCSINYAVTYFRAEPLCETLNGNQLPVLTITAIDATSNEILERETIFLTARVHPGESNSSWIMLGTLQFLLSSHPQAVSLRKRYVFKVVPMLNVEGVINGW
ncbi:hypothetical protein RUM43_005176 [Polyplax serrata]|uniref:tubulin-glutamate carboxypeptidase n=1 Tax=Polyplax serrata TaxID=468196 RepID=A0AAN8SF39_POLSC